jgi:hypothetical protein
MKKLYAILLALILCVTAGFAGGTNHFNGKELSISLGTGYALDGGFSDVKNFAQKYDLNLNAGASYFVTRYLGIEAEVPFYQTKGVSVDRVSAGPVLRLPLFDRVAPFIQPNVTYNWHDNKFSYGAAFGLEERLWKGWGLQQFANYGVSSFSADALKHGNWSLGAKLTLQF